MKPKKSILRFQVMLAVETRHPTKLLALLVAVATLVARLVLVHFA